MPEQELSERITRLEDKVDHFGERLLGVVEEVRKTRDSIGELFVKHDKILMGNGREGVIVRMDRIEQREDSRKWLLRAIVGTLIVVAAKLLFEV